MMLILLPVAPRLLVRFATKWVLGAGLVIMGAGATCGWPRPITPTCPTPALWAPLLLIGIGIALALAAFTAGAVNGMPTTWSGMASGANNMLRDLGATLRPAVIGAVALSQAASRISGRLRRQPFPARSRRGLHRVSRPCPGRPAPGARRRRARGAVRAAWRQRGPRRGDAAERSRDAVQSAARRGLSGSDARLRDRLRHLRGSRGRT